MKSILNLNPNNPQNLDFANENDHIPDNPDNPEYLDFVNEDDLNPNIPLILDFVNEIDLNPDNLLPGVPGFYFSRIIPNLNC